ncbi:MAG TPA: helix-turn-helix transcriptional regulator [Thermoanaerobaculia bacterium]|nr:helix-turn-helix transcriptional regulator [Thermoanaerobaculia bacterium]
MIHEEVKQARMAAGLSVTEVARLADIPRKQVYALEDGANVTLDTVRRIVAVIPNLHRVTLGGLDVVTANADLEEARRAAFDLFDVVKRLLSALGAVPPAPQQSVVVHPRSGSKTERQTAQRLEKMVREGKHKRRRSDS